MLLREQEHFDGIAQVFDERFNAYHNAAAQARIIRRVQIFAAGAVLNAESRVLEIGCGTAAYSRALRRVCPRLFCTDISLGMVREGMRKARGAESPFFFLSDVERLAVKPGMLDCVVGNAIIHHLHVPCALSRIYEALKKGGRLMFFEPNMRNPLVFLQKKIPFLRALSGDSPGESAFVRGDIHALLSRAGFRSISVTPFDFLHPRTPALFVPAMSTLGIWLEQLPWIQEIAGSLCIKAVK